MTRAWIAVVAGALAGTTSACAPVAAQQDQGLRPPPAYEREYQTYCQNRPGGCAGGYGQTRDDFLTRRQEDAMDTIRRREEELLRQLQQQQQLRR